jgi:hypothetical protein
MYPIITYKTILSVSYKTNESQFQRMVRRGGGMWDARFGSMRRVFIGFGGVGCSAVVVVLERQDSPFCSTKALEIEPLLGNLGLALCDNVINVSIRMTRIVMEED